MNAPSRYTAGDAAVAWLLALPVAGISCALAITLVFIVDALTANESLYAGELLSSFLYLALMGTMLTAVFGFIPFAVAGAALMLTRTLSPFAFAAAGSAAGLVAAVIFVQVTANGSAAGFTQLRETLLVGAMAIPAIAGGLAGGVFAWWYLRRAAARRARPVA